MSLKWSIKKWGLVVSAFFALATFFHVNYPDQRLGRWALWMLVFVAAVGWTAASRVLREEKRKRAMATVVVGLLGFIASVAIWKVVEPADQKNKKDTMPQQNIEQKMNNNSATQQSSGGNQSPNISGNNNTINYGTINNVPAPELSKKERDEIVKKIIDRYISKHKGSTPTEKYVNERLAKQGANFTVHFSGGRIPPPSIYIGEGGTVHFEGNEWRGYDQIIYAEKNSNIDFRNNQVDRTPPTKSRSK